MTWTQHGTLGDSDVLTDVILNQLNANIVHLKSDFQIAEFDEAAAITTTATSFASMGASYESTFTPNAGSTYLFMLHGAGRVSGAGNLMHFDLEIAGARVGDATVGMAVYSGMTNAGTFTTNPYKMINVWWIVNGLAQVSTTFKWMWKVSAGTGTFAGTDWGRSVHREL